MNLSDHFWVHEIQSAGEAAMMRDLERRRIALERAAEITAANVVEARGADAAAPAATRAGAPAAAVA
ncbi:hypothetical protein [Agromyces allii]|uniref:Uncharacterized protein n=1 Tax=Agromyces allii TaxID=393607 RepID=A0ABN2QZD2_9MICO|nr:hypothetical protein [Agromyces allii]